MKFLKGLNENLLKAFDVMMFVSSGLVCIMIVIGAFMRYILKLDFYGSEELILIAAFWMYYIGSAVATYEDSHITADLISSSLKNEVAIAVQKIFKFVVSLFLFGILTVWAWNFIQFSLTKGQTTPVYKLPMVISQISLLISFGLSSIYTLMHLVISVKSLKTALERKKNGEVGA